MSIVRRLAQVGERRGLTPESVPAFAGIPSNGEQFDAGTGEIVSDRTALQLIAVQACVGLLADQVASLPLTAYRKGPDGLRIPLDPQPSLVVNPFANADYFEGMFAMMSPLAMRGEALNVVTGLDALERVTSFETIHPDDWTVRKDRSTGKVTYRVAGVKLDPGEVFHIRRFRLPGSLHGLSPIGAAQRGIGIGLAAERYGARYFADASDPRSTLTTDAALTDDQVKQTQAQWVNTHGGRRLPAVLTGGFEYKAISINPDEAQFLETRKFQRSEIAMLFRVPPHMIGDTEKATSWGTGIEQQSIGFVTYTLRPWLTCIESAISSLLPRGQFAKFNVDALLRGDTKSRNDAYTQARNAGWMSVNEIRSLEDMPPIPDGDNYLQPLNMGPLGSDPLAAKEAPSDPQK
ncbi:MAG: phage portal protein [Nocardioidaceae bacterium]|nr:MAG: phage portal protein [Nocardioidaceae bacterium]